MPGPASPPRDQREKASIMARRARRHFASITALRQLDCAERGATGEQFSAAARIAARCISKARGARLPLREG